MIQWNEEEYLDFNQERIWTILHLDLDKIYICVKFVPRIWTNEQESMGVYYSCEIVSASKNEASILKSIVTGDETLCFQFDPWKMKD